MASSWTDEDSRVAAEKIIKRAEISKVLPLNTHDCARLAWLPNACLPNLGIFFRVFWTWILIEDYSATKITVIDCAGENVLSGPDIDEC